MHLDQLPQAIRQFANANATLRVHATENLYVQLNLSELLCIISVQPKLACLIATQVAGHIDVACGIQLVV